MDRKWSFLSNDVKIHRHQLKVDMLNGRSCYQPQCSDMIKNTTK
jgi:hypothetical protein